MVDAWLSSRRAVAGQPRDRRNLRGVMTTSCHREESQRRHSYRTMADGQSANRRPQSAADAGVARETAAADLERGQDYSKRRRARRGQKTALKASPLTRRFHSITFKCTPSLS